LASPKDVEVAAFASVLSSAFTMTTARKCLYSSLSLLLILFGSLVRGRGSPLLASNRSQNEQTFGRCLHLSSPQAARRQPRRQG
jgi:hypothetical protein